MEAYETFNKDMSKEVSLKEFKQLKMSKEPQFRFWLQVLELELDVLQYVRCIREGNVDLYVQMLDKLVPWFFSMGHINYARWVPVHIRDLILAKDRNPDIYNEFQNGKFVITKTLNAFSKMTIDQAHEQENERIKGDGGAVGSTEDPAALLRWMVAGPEVARAVTQFEIQYISSLSEKEHLHHEETTSIQTAFHEDAKNTVSVIREMGNPFAEDTGELIALDAKRILTDILVQRMDSIRDIGEEKYQEYVEHVLRSTDKPISASIPRVNHQIFSDCISSKRKSKEKQQVKDLKQNIQLLGRLYINCIARGGDIDDFIRHENLPFPLHCLKMGNLDARGTSHRLYHAFIQNTNLYLVLRPLPRVASLLMDQLLFIIALQENLKTSKSTLRIVSYLK